MLFLAVLCGFLAEYQLEHKIEKDRERQFIKSLIADLTDDTSKIEDYIKNEHEKLALLDTLCYYLDDPELAKQNTDAIYYAARVGPRTAPLINNSRTFDQLTYSGGFRLIHSTGTSNKIMGYYSQLPMIRLLVSNFTREFDMYRIEAAKVIDPGILRKNENPDGTIRRSTDHPPLLSYDRAQLKQVEFFAVQMNGSRRSLIPLMDSLKNSAFELAQYLGEKYHIK